jgi:endonuclease/exonuclease/phosphatase family metal-dependent hydrolase
MGKLCLALGLAGLRVFGFVTDPWLSDDEIHRVVGDSSRVHRAAMPGEALKVVTWNIERGSAYDAILSTISLLDPDVLLLQEVDRDCRRTNYRNIAAELAAALDMNWVAAGEFQELGEARRGAAAITGQAILSKFSIENAVTVRFRAQNRWRWSINPVQPRRGGRIALKAHTGGLMVYNTHIESGGNEPLQQKQMAEILADQARLTGGTPVLVAGDFNNGPLLHSISLNSLAHASFIDALGDASQRGPTSIGQHHPIDWIFSKHMGLGRGRVVDASAASDHSPVMAAFSRTQPLSVSR